MESTREMKKKGKKARERERERASSGLYYVLFRAGWSKVAWLKQ